MGKSLIKPWLLCIAFLFVMGITKSRAQVSNNPYAGTYPGYTDSAKFHPVTCNYDSLVKINYVRTREARGRVTDSSTFNDNFSAQLINETIQYIDGLGRPVQTVMRQKSPVGNDVVVPTIYDSLGREVLKFLPYVQTSGSHSTDGTFKKSPFADQYTFSNAYYNATAAAGYREEIFYGKTNLEASPLNRTLSTMDPGNEWAGSERGIETKYLTNKATDSVRIWNISNDTLTYVNNDTTTNVPVSSSFYGTAQLYKTVTKNEEGSATVEYKNKDGLVILRKVQIGTVPADFTGYAGFLSTYYIYDDFNSLRFVIQPKAVSALHGANNWQLSGSMINELCFRYEYDTRNRVVAKKTPGAGWKYMVYDSRDRLVFTQDATIRNRNLWLAILYDPLNRQTTTGFITYSGTRSTLQQSVTSQTDSSTISIVPVQASYIKQELFVNNRQQGTQDYLAENKVVISPQFVSESSANFVVALNNATHTAADTVTISSNPLPVSADSLIVLTRTYYDDYSYSPTTSYNESYNNKLDTGVNYWETLPTQTEQSKVFTKGLVTFTRVRVIGNPDSIPNGDFLTTANLYDDLGRVIQVHSENFKTGIDTITNRYDFTGDVICSYLVHNNPVAGAAGITNVKTTFEYDNSSRLLKVWKVINDDSSSKALIVSNEYDELGQLKKKELGKIKDVNGAYTDDPIETLEYEYNPRGWLRYVNKDYSSNTGSGNDRWFGLELCYDKGFDSANYTGNISGIKWRSKGYGYQQAFGYSYDKSDRLMGASYSKFLPRVGYYAYWGDYNVRLGDGTDPSTAYDENGNIRSMKHWTRGYGYSKYPRLIDDLVYNYYGNSNKLLNVIDTIGGQNMGDFGTSTLHPNYNSKTSTTIDYTYDESGSLLKDLNKAIGTSITPGIQYNQLNLPYKITVQDSLGVKGTITYVYTALGEKLEKRIAETGQPEKKTAYITGFEYEDDKLEFFSHEEGRTRFGKKYFENGDSAYQFFHDFFIKDHLGNIRMVLTEQNDTSSYFATSEDIYRAKEEQLFSNISSTAYADSLVPGGYPIDTSLSNPNHFVTRLNGDNSFGTRIGPSILLKVSAGDKISIGVKAFYRPNSSPGGNADILFPALTLLSDLAVGAADPIKGYIGSVGNTFSPVYDQALWAIDNARDSTHFSTPGKPKAYLNWVFLDENFDGVFTYPEMGAIHAGDPDVLNTLAINGIDIKQGGYLYIYTSNDTKNWDVFFDNLAIKHYKGPFVEESHYYPFGLEMQGNNSKALRTNLSENDRKYNGILKENGLGIEIYDANLRELDPQIGRWWEIDPKIENMEMWSPYASNYDNPIKYSDPLGDEGNDDGCCLGLKKAFASISGAVIGTIDNNIPGSNLRGAVASSGIIQDPEVAESWNKALDVADVTSLVQGVGESTIGGGMASTSIALTIGSGGTTSEVTAPAAALGTGMVAHGAFVTGKSAGNLASQNGRVNVSSNQTGSYTNSHQSGKTYSGKGGQKRAKESGERVAKEHNDPVSKSDWKPSKNTREAFKAEDKRIQKNGGAGNTKKNYNKINSPGRKYNNP